MSLNILSKLWLRQVIVPTINDNENYINNFKQYIKQFKNVEKVELLAYHTMGVVKYEKLHIKYKLKGIEPLSKEKLNELNKILMS